MRLRWLRPAAVLLTLAAPASARSLVPLAQECVVTAESFGHAPVPLLPDQRLTLEPHDQGFRLTWSGLVVDLGWQAPPRSVPLQLSGTDSHGVTYDANLAPDGSFVLVGRPGGIEYGLTATCAPAPR